MSSKAAEAVSKIFEAAKSREELCILLDGMLTPQELEETVVRWQLMVELTAGETQRDIAHKLGISLGTIARGSRLLKYGPSDFRALFERIQRDLTDDATDR